MEVTRSLYLNKLIDSRKNSLIKVITGISRCGRSYLLFSSYYDYLISKGVGESHIIDIPLEDKSSKKYRKRDELLNYLKNKIEDNDTYYIFLDEVQLLDDYKEVILYLKRIENVDLYVTSTDLGFLYSEFVNEFGDDCYEIRVRPMSFKEVVHADDRDTNITLDDYLKFGGLPMVWWMESADDKRDYLSDAFLKSYVYEMIEKHNIKNVEEYVTVITLLSHFMGELINPLKISNTMPISDKTAKKYIEYLCDQFLVNKVNRYDIKKKRYITTPSKYYFEDIGLRNAVLGFEDFNIDSLMENVIYNELKLREYKVDIGVVEYNYKDDNGCNKKRQLEVDFIAVKSNRKYYIQSSYSGNNAKKKTYSYIKDSFKKICIVYEDTEPKYDESGIMTMGLRQFLMDDNSLEL